MRSDSIAIRNEADVRVNLRRLKYIMLGMTRLEKQLFLNRRVGDVMSPLVFQAVDIVDQIRLYDWYRNRRDGDWFLVDSGWRFWPQDPRAGDFNIEDVAHHLSGIRRYNGGVDNDYSVAQHCVHMCDFVPGPLKFLALMHDAPEAYLGDLLSPVKRILPGFVALESLCWSAMCQQYHITYTEDDWLEVKRWDDMILHTEAQLFCPAGMVACRGFYGGVALPDAAVTDLVNAARWSRAFAREQFLERYRRFAPSSLRAVWSPSGKAGD